MTTLKTSQQSFFEKISRKAAETAGGTAAFITALSIIIIWLLTGPVFDYSDTWQLIINTGTTVITFLMVFLIQRSQNKDSIALHLKLNEIIKANKNASNILIAVEEIREEDLIVLKQFYAHLADLAKQHRPIDQSHSIEEALVAHNEKKQNH